MVHRELQEVSVCWLNLSCSSTLQKRPLLEVNGELFFGHQPNSTLNSWMKQCARIFHEALQLVSAANKRNLVTQRLKLTLRHEAIACEYDVLVLLMEQLKTGKTQNIILVKVE